jgi:S-adenosylmethionine hydrolase
MAIVTLTTDFGHKDYSVSVIKGALLQQLPDLTIVDISHQISPYNVSETAYILKNAFRAFPEGSIHIIGVESEWTPENVHLAMEYEGHYFICADNGILSMIKEDVKATKLVEITIHQNVVRSFPVLDIFIHVAAHLVRKGALEVIGKPISQIKELTNIKPVIHPEGNQILGSVIYIDNYGNLITNIKKNPFSRNWKIEKFYHFCTFCKI